MSVLALLLVIVGTVLLLCAAFGFTAGRVGLGWLGLAFIAIAVWVIPALNAI